MKMYKTCKNDSCNQMNTKIRCSNTDKFCMKCGQPLVHICYTCLRTLDSDTAKYCDSCIAMQEQKKQERKENIAHGIETVPKIAGAVMTAMPVVSTVASKLPKKK